MNRAHGAFSPTMHDQFTPQPARPPLPDRYMQLLAEKNRLIQALGNAAIALDCVDGLQGHNAAHVHDARAAIRIVLGC